MQKQTFSEFEKEDLADQNQYVNITLKLSEEIYIEVKKLSARYCNTDSDFVAIILKMRFEWIKHDVEDLQFTFIKHYLDIVESRRGSVYKKRKDDKLKVLSISLPASYINTENGDFLGYFFNFTPLLHAIDDISDIDFRLGGEGF
jgi:hypothetical protein